MNQSDVIDLRAITHKLIQKRKVFYWVIPITFVVSALLILCVPRYYNCKITLAPELSNTGAAGTLGSLVNSFGFDFGAPSEDAIYPILYPDVVHSSDFIISLFDIPIVSSDKQYNGTYYNYLLSHQRYPFWTWTIRKIKSFLTPRSFKTSGGNPDKTNELDPFWLNRNQVMVINLIQEKVICTVDKKTDVISISVTDQDPLICAVIADSVRSRLQEFMTRYHTQKAKDDMEYYSQLMKQAKEELDIAKTNYIHFIDGHSNMSQEHYRVEANNLKDEMELRQTAYSTFQKQYMAAQTKLQENTPIFTNIQGASVPFLPTGPRRVVFVLFMCMFVGIVTTLWLCRHELHITI